MSFFSRSKVLPKIAISGFPNSGQIYKVANQDVQQKLNYIKLSNLQSARMKQLHEIVTAKIDPIVSFFYDEIMQVAELRAIVDRHSSIPKLKGTFKEYILQMLNIHIDEQYIQSRQKIGRVHDHVKLRPEWFMGAYHILRKSLIPTIIEEYQHEPQVMAEMIIALDNITTFDNVLMIEEYIKSFTSQMLEIEQIRKIQVQLQNDSQNLAAAAQETTASANEMALTMNHIRTEALDAAQYTYQVVELANSGGQQIQAVTNAMKEINEDFNGMQINIAGLNDSSAEIAKIIDTISQIANQTNLLALNASIEAARAGEHGRGFAVVAEEVRKLAEDTDKALKDISDKIKKSRKDTNEVLEGMTRTAKSVTDGAVLTERTIAGFTKITDAVQSSLKITERVADGISHNASIAEQIKDASENVAMLAEGLANLSGELN